MPTRNALLPVIPTISQGALEFRDVGCREVFHVKPLLPMAAMSHQPEAGGSEQHSLVYLQVMGPDSNAKSSKQILNLFKFFI